MKILHILADDATPQEEQNLVNMACAFNKLGIEQYAILNPKQNISDTLEKENITINIQKFNGIFDLRTKKFISGFIEKTSPHIVQTHTPISARFCDNIPKKIAHVGILSGSTNDSKTISICNGAFSFNSNDNQSENIFYVLPIIEDMDPNAEPVNNEEFDTPEDCFLLGTSTDTTEEFNIDPIFKAIREIPEVYFWISCTEENKQELQDLTIKRALHDRVRLLTCIKNEVSFLKSLDLYIIPEQKKDTFYLISKPWIAKTPVLSGLSDKPYPIEHKINGWIVDGSNVLRIRESIVKLMQENELRDQVAENGFNSFQKLYEKESIIKDYMRAYKNILSKL